MWINLWSPLLITRCSSSSRQPLSRVNLTGSTKKKQENIFKTDFAQMSLASQKIWVAQNWVALQPPCHPRPHANSSSNILFNIHYFSLSSSFQRVFRVLLLATSSKNILKKELLLFRRISCEFFAPAIVKNNLIASIVSRFNIRWSKS